MRLSAEVLIHHHAVDQKDVVIRRSAVDCDLAIDTVRVHPWSEQHGLPNVARHRQFGDRLLFEVRANLCRLQHGRCRRGDGNRLGHAAHPHRCVSARGRSQRKSDPLGLGLHALQAELHRVVSWR